LAEKSFELQKMTLAMALGLLFGCFIHVGSICANALTIQVMGGEKLLYQQSSTTGTMRNSRHIFVFFVVWFLITAAMLFMVLTFLGKILVAIVKATRDDSKLSVLRRNTTSSC
jgi:hypothetical protein